MFQHLVVPFKNLDGIPALLFLRQTVHSRLLNMSQRMFHRTGESMLWNSLCALCGLDCRFRRFHHTVSLQGGNLHHFTAQLAGKILRIQLITVLLHNVHHIDGNHHRYAKLYQLRGQVQIPFQVGSVNDIQDRVRPFIDQVVPGDNFFQGIRGQAVDTRKVGDRNPVMLPEFAFLLFHRNAGPVSDKLV